MVIVYIMLLYAVLSSFFFCYEISVQPTPIYLGLKALLLLLLLLYEISVHNMGSSYPNEIDGQPV
jgi:hypothetical protein